MPMPRAASKPVVVQRPVGSPFWETSDGKTICIWRGNALEVLKMMPTGAVHTCVTSPPYYNLRDYKTGEWVGGNSSCDHLKPSLPTDMRNRGSSTLLGGVLNQNAAKLVNGYRETCGKCGANKVDDQLGHERTPQEYVDNLVTIFREMRRVLRDDGVFWLNIGDSRSNDGNVLGVPWQVAFGLQNDGWVLRQDCIWFKPSPQPESVKNRCTTAHEYMFLFTKSTDYYYDHVAIKTSSLTPGRVVEYNGSQKNCEAAKDNLMRTRIAKTVTVAEDSNKRSVWSVEDDERMFWWVRDNYPEVFATFLQESVNKGSVWKVAAQGYAGAHFACFGENLIEPCILAGSSAHGACPDCGSPYRRITEDRKLTRERPNDYVKRTGEKGTGNSCSNSVAGVEVKTVGWQPSCTCHGAGVEVKGKRLKSLREAKGVVDDQFKVDAAVRAISGEEWREWQQGEHGEEDYVDSVGEEHVGVSSLLPSDAPPPVPCIVLDPFLGSGTSLVCALKHGRRGWGIELSEKYITENAIPRVTSRLVDLGLSHLVPGRERTKTDVEPLELG